MKQTVYPALSYEDAPAAIAWLKSALGFEEKAIHGGDGRIDHAELALGDSIVMLGSTAPDDPDRLTQPSGGSSVYIVLGSDAEIDAHYDRAKAAGAEITRELRDEDYGSHGYTVRDPEGNYWSFGTYQPS